VGIVGVERAGKVIETQTITTRGIPAILDKLTVLK